MWMNMFPPQANTELSLGLSLSETVLSDHLINFSRSHVTVVNRSRQRLVHVGSLCVFLMKPAFNNYFYEFRFCPKPHLKLRQLSVSPPSDHPCVWFVFVRSGRTSLRRSSFWDSCDTPTPSSIKAATWKTTLPGLVGAFPPYLVFCCTLLFLVCNPLFLYLSLLQSVVSTSAASSFVLTSAAAVVLLALCKKEKGNVLSFFFTLEYVMDSGETAFSFSWSWSIVWALHQIY